MSDEHQRTPDTKKQDSAIVVADQGSAARSLGGVANVTPGTAGRRWSHATRVVFRFSFVYLGLFCLTTQIFGSMFPIPKLDIPDLASLPPLRQIVFWAAAHAFRIKTPLVYQGSGSGDKVFDWVLCFCLLLIAALGTLIWSALDRKRDNYIALHKYFRLFLRFALAGQMLAYGLAKVVPLQMPFPYLTRLLEPYGRFSPMGVLWASIGASPGYQIFAGCAETVGGLLLIIPRTTLLGALVCLADITEVLTLNMTYDVPVKLLSFHLLLMSVFLLAPDARHLANFFFLNRDVPSSSQLPIFRKPRTNRIALAIQLLYGGWILAIGIYGSWQGWHEYGGGREKPALYGIWDVEEMSVDGQVRSLLINDYGRWRRAIFDFPTIMSFQRMDDSFAGYNAAYDNHKRTITLTMGSDKSFKGTLVYQRDGQDRLTLDGEMDGHKTSMRLRRIDHTKFLLASRSFHWVQEYPFNR